MSGKIGCYSENTMKVMRIMESKARRLSAREIGIATGIDTIVIRSILASMMRRLEVEKIRASGESLHYILTCRGHCSTFSNFGSEHIEGMSNIQYFFSITEPRCEAIYC